MNLYLDWCSHEAARFACEHWHYSKSVPVNPMRIGVWENDKYIGCILFSYGANNHIGTPFGLKQQQICELTRVALTKHKTPVTKLLAIAIKMLKKQCPGIKLIVSYADADQGHDGGIYKGGNWVYTGLTNANTRSAFIVNGKKTHPKTIHSKGVKQSLSEIRRLLDPHAECYFTKGKHKYLMPLDDDMRKQIEHLRQPYPKRAKQAISSDQELAEGQHLPARSILGDETE